MPLTAHSSPTSQCCGPNNTTATDLHFLFAPQAEAIQTLVVADVAEHGLNHGHTITENCFALLAIYSVFRPVDVIGCAFVFSGE